MIKVGVVDDHPLLLAGVERELPAAARDVRVVATAPSVAELLARGERCDVVLLDLRLADGSRPEQNVVDLRAAGAEVLVYTEGSRRHSAAAALASGALGVAVKGDPVTALADAVRQVAGGATAVSPVMARAMEAAALRTAALSPQEREVLRLYAADLPAKSVARRLGITEGTVKEYLKRIRAKLAAASLPAPTKLELRNVAEDLGLLDEEDDPTADPSS